jgi:probable phosphoglycerate mutase
MSTPRLVILVRHAQSEHHVLGLTGGWTDTPLTALGHEQSQALGARLRDELGAQPVRLYSSDLLRAMDTAQHIGEAFGVEAIADARLREHNNGECADLTIEEAKARWPDTWAVPVPLDVRAYPGAETPREFYDRTGGFIDDLDDDGTIPIVVTHGGTMICLVARWLRLAAEAVEPIGFSAYTTGITVLESDAHGSRIVERLNDTAHLGGGHGSASLGDLLAKLRR